MASSSATTMLRKPNQPSDLNFPLRNFETKEVKRSFQSSWFQKWSWLDYKEASDSVICLYCSHAFDNTLLTDALYKRAIHDVIALVQSFSAAETDLMSQVVTLVKLVLVMAAINTKSERSFSAMRHTKTYLRSTMLQEHMNATMVLHVHDVLSIITNWSDSECVKLLHVHIALNCCVSLLPVPFTTIHCIMP